MHSVPGTSNILSAKYRGREKPLDEFGVFFPFFDTFGGHCTYIRPDSFFAPSAGNKSLSELMVRILDIFIGLPK